MHGQRSLYLVLVVVLLSWMSLAQTSSPAAPSGKIHAGSRIFVAPMVDGFDTFVSAAIFKKQVPLTIVTDRTKADYEISGISESEKAGWAKMLFLGSQQTAEQASVKVTDIQSGAVVYAYSVNKGNSYKGKQSAAEACAKHLKEKIESGS